MAFRTGFFKVAFLGVDAERQPVVSVPNPILNEKETKKQEMEQQNPSFGYEI